MELLACRRAKFPRATTAKPKAITSQLDMRTTVLAGHRNHPVRADTASWPGERGRQRVRDDAV
jgi:hypothetical protein